MAVLDRRELVNLLPALPLPDAAAQAYGEIRADLERKGGMNNDLWIAAHALASGLTLVTNNEDEFWRVRGLKVPKLDGVGCAKPSGDLSLGPLS